MAAGNIIIKGAREHNLRSIDVVLPRHQLICLTGVSGSGKSSLAFDTLYAEGQRRYVESLSSFARQFLGQMPKPDVDAMEGLSPSISISQKTSGQNPRSTVGTITEIYDFLRVLYARVGQGHCPQCDRPISAQTRDEIIERIARLPVGTKFMILAPLIRGQKGEYRDLFEELLKQGFVRARVDGRVVALSDKLSLDRQMRHNIEVVVDRLTASPAARPRLAEAVDLALKLGEGNLMVTVEDAVAAPAQGQSARSPARKESKRKARAAAGDEAADEAAATQRGAARQAAANLSTDMQLSAHYACTACGLSFEPPSPQLFSFNSPQGMCTACDGLGEKYDFDPAKLVPDARLSFKEGCVELLGPWENLGRWRRHIYQGVADTLEYKFGLQSGTILDTPWERLEPRFREMLLHGTGDMHITYTWPGGGGIHKYGGKFDGIIPDLMNRFRTTGSAVQRRQLEKYMSQIPCAACRGTRLNPQARSVRLRTRHPRFQQRPALTLPEVCALSVAEAVDFFSELELGEMSQFIAAEVLKEVRGRLGFLLGVGLDYLALDRTAPTLSGGESQRIRLAGQIGCGLVGVTYILDEPSIGLHPRDNQRLLESLLRLRDLGNTVVVVEHDEETMRAADHIIDFGPGAGVRGGEVVASGRFEEILSAPRSVTGKYLAGKETIAIPAQRRAPGKKWLTISGARHNNLKDVEARFPLGTFICVTGVSGSGKSSLVNDILAQALLRDLNGGAGKPGAYRKIDGLQHLDKLIAIDQSPIGRTPRSNPGTYIKVFDDIRKLFAQLPESKARGYREGRFSFNVGGGRCEACEGNGSNRLEMDFLADVWVTCPVCEGHRFNRETLQVRFKGKSIAEVLEMDVQQALVHFENVPKIRHKLQTLHDVGLDYIKIGQPSPTLSGGEAQRIKLARELVKRGTGKTLYLLDEPTTGLHFHDIKMLLKVLHDFVDAGNTVLVVEHNLDVIKTADWLIDLGPEGGAEGGRIIAEGTPEEVAANPDSYTGQALAALFAGKHFAFRQSHAQRPRGEPAKAIIVRGAKQHNLKDIDVQIPRDSMTVCCGPSGSGKSSLAMDTIYAEGQRRYVESLSAYARQFVGQMQKPQLEHIEGLSPAIAIEQKNTGHTPRSTVGTVTEIHDYFRILMARLGKPFCPACDVPIGTQTVDEIVDKITDHAEGTRLYIMAPLEVQVGETYDVLWEEVRAGGYARVRVDGTTYSLDAVPVIDRRRKHDVQVVVDRVIVQPDARRRIADSLESALALGRGVLHVAYVDEKLPEPKWLVKVHSQHYACDQCGRSFEPLTPHNFSFNSALGWCEACQGLGTQRGANPASLIRDPRATLLEGALALWPELQVHGESHLPGRQSLARQMLQALCEHASIPGDVPFEQLTHRQRRTLLHGCGEDWIPVHADGAKGHKGPLLFHFQFKGLYPALEEASRLSTAFRARLDHLIDEVECSVCGGSRLRDDAAAVRFRDRTMRDYGNMPLGKLLADVKSWKLAPHEAKIAGELVKEIRNRLQFLVDVGLDYLTLGRPAPTLSGGEAQRIRLASQVGSGLTGVLYVLDEPTIGLHPRDNRRLLNALHKLRDLGNTLLVVEHDRDVVQSADQLLDFGPGAGRFGGQIVARGTPAEVVKQANSVTGPFLSGRKAIPVPTNRRRVSMRHDAFLEIQGARHNNLKNIDVRIPLGTLTAVTGVSGSGKSSLVEDVLYGALAKVLHRASTVPAAYDRLIGVNNINKVIRVDQQPLGNTPTSNPATYTGAFELIRELFAQLPEAKVRGFSARRFSFNVPGGRCEKCEGNGQLRVEMHFLPDVWVPCDVCRGQRYNPDTLAVRYKGKSISDVLEMSIGDAMRLFENIPKIRRILRMLCDVGLDYLTLGQSAPTLSGGEAQRVKLAAELARPDTGRTLYLLDEPTTGLHFEDLAKLLEVLHRLVDLGNTVVVIEHNLDVIKSADWVIDIGPEAGADGGQIVVEGTPEDIVAHLDRKPRADRSRNGKPASGNGAGARRGAPRWLPSHTAEALKPVLLAGPHELRRRFDPATYDETRADDVDITEIGRDIKMPWEADGRRWHTVDRVGRNGEPCRWDGRILARVVDRIHELGEFGPTNWNDRSVVEICAAKKSDGWFFHALTSDPWLLKMKFRVAKRTFQRDHLVASIGLKPLNEMPDLPVYGNEPRVKCKTIRGPWQEIELRVHSLDEIDRPEFWSFLEQAVKGFTDLTERKAESPEDLMPWKVLGKKWHFSRKGFPPGKTPQWPIELLEELCELIDEAAGGPQFLWQNQQVVNVFVPAQRDVWAAIYTKRLAALELVLSGPKGAFAFGRVAGLGREAELLTNLPQRDVLKLKFVTLEDLRRGDLAEFLREHVAAVVG